VDGRYRGKIERDPLEVRNTVITTLPILFKDPDYSIRIQAIRTCAKLGVAAVTSAIVDAMTDDKNAEVRSAGFEALVVLDQRQAQIAIKKILATEEEPVRVTALQQLELLNIDPTEIAGSLNNILTGGTSQEKQAALSALVNLPKESIVDQLSLMMDELISGNVNEALQLDLLEVALNNGDESVLEKIEIFRKKYADLGNVANYIECLEGGTPRAGRGVLINNSAAQCLKCHAISGYGGVAGPPLDNIGAKRDRLFVLQSLIEPSAHLAPGYGVVTVILKNDQAVSGILLSEDEKMLSIKDSNGTDIRVDQSEIKERINALSSMPPMGDILSKKEIRNLIAFLMTLKGEEL
jgi:putative heme-binding domain-containing protein